MTRLRLILAAVLVFAILAFGVYSCRERQIVVQQTQHADTNHQMGETHEAAAVPHDDKADALALDNKALRAEVARLRKAAAPSMAVGAPPNPLAPVVEAQDRLITNLDAQNAELTASRDEHRSAAQAYKAEAGNLREVIAHTPKVYNRALGLFISTDGAKGISGSYDFRRLTVGADAVIRPLPVAGRSEFAVNARVMVRF